MSKIPYLIFILLTLVSGLVHSHPLSVSYAEFRVEGSSLVVTYRLPMDDMDLLLGLDSDLNDNVSLSELAGAAEGINSYIEGHTTIQINQEITRPAFQSMNIWLDSDDFPYLETIVVYTGQQPVSYTKIQLGFLSDLYPDHRTLASLTSGTVSSQFVFQHSNIWEWQSESLSIWSSAIEFIVFGLEHIVTGYDHLLFLLGLLIVARGLKNLIIIVTAFTVAHSITLALATLGLVQPVGWVVESAIALSIVYVGVENLLVDEVKHRWRITFAFGLIHGFGFAGLLQELDLERAGLLLSLFTFNLGVELGQVAIVALAWPVLKRVSITEYRKTIVRTVSVLITIFGLIWFVQRAFM